ncbi:MAG: HAD family hydrolase [Acidobacteriaceae bacterium]|nr:HAD family hydrolase [Acidobacteriaceae bacterium]
MLPRNSKPVRYRVLASDYDGTLARDGIVDPETIDALARLRHSGRKLILVTGRELPDLEKVFNRLDLFDRVVAENGALLSDPQTRRTRALALRPPDEFIEELRRRGVQNLSVGEVILATWHPYETEALSAIRDFGLELQLIFNKDAVMILPSGINKMTGLTHALEELQLSRHNVVGVGDAENDHAFLGCCECAIAVANAIPSLKDRVDLVTTADHGAGVTELIEKIIEDDLASLSFALERHGILLGSAGDEKILLPPYQQNLLVCGQSGSGKSTLVAGFMERLMDQGYQFCLIDPEGDYESMAGCVTVGDERHAPSLEQLAHLLEKTDEQLIVNMVGVAMADRAAFFTSVFALLEEKRLQTGRPHWIVIDEAHHMLPHESASGTSELVSKLGSTLMITVHPEHVSPDALNTVDTIIAVGREPHLVMNEFAEIAGVPPPDVPTDDLAPGEALIWFRDSQRVLPRVRVEPPRAERNRHKRKYAQGELEDERVFYFRGPEKKLNLRAQNLITFLQLADGVDDDTWLFHLKRADYSNWFRCGIKDTAIADQIARIEQNDSLSAAESRAQIKEAVESKYTAPA